MPCDGNFINNKTKKDNCKEIKKCIKPGINVNFGTDGTINVPCENIRNCFKPGGNVTIENDGTINVPCENIRNCFTAGSNVDITNGTINVPCENIRNCFKPGGNVTIENDGTINVPCENIRNCFTAGSNVIIENGVISFDPSPYTKDLNTAVPSRNSNFINFFNHTIPDPLTVQSPGVNPRNGLFHNGLYYYVTDAGRLQVIDPKTAQLVHDLNIPAGAANIVKNANGSKMFINVGNSNNLLVVLDTTTMMTTTVDLVDSNPYSLCFNSDYSKLYVGGISNPNNLRIINPVNNSIIATIPNVKAQSMIPYNNLIIGASLNHQMFFIDTITDTITYVDTGPNLHPFGITVANGKAYMTNRMNSEVVVVDINTKNIVARINIPTTFPNNIENLSYISSENNKVFVTNRLMSTLTVIDAVTDTIITTISTGTGGGARSVEAKDGYVVVVNFLGRNAKVYKTDSLMLYKTITIGDLPLHLVLEKPEYKYAY